MIEIFRYGTLPTRYRNLANEVRSLKPRFIVEVGVYRGDCSEMLIKEALKLGDAVDYWGFDLFAEAITDDVLVEERSLLPISIRDVEKRLGRPGATLHLVGGDTKETLAAADLPAPDLVFLDGGHLYETVRSDWENLERVLHPRSVVYFDDYLSGASLQHEPGGVNRVVDSLDTSEWQVDILPPINRYKRPYGFYATQFARVCRR